MKDQQLDRLLDAMDHMARTDGDDLDVSDELELVRLRAQNLSRRTGRTASESPYLAFLRRSVARLHPRPLAASA